jgi:hypothetical protein
MHRFNKLECWHYCTGRQNVDLEASTSHLFDFLPPVDEDLMEDIFGGSGTLHFECESTLGSGLPRCGQAHPNRHAAGHCSAQHLTTQHLA